MKKTLLCTTIGQIELISENSTDLSISRIEQSDLPKNKGLY